MPIPTSPSDLIVILVVVELLPSAVVRNSSLPGVSLAHGVPSTVPRISAATLPISVPSAPLNLICPR